MSDEVPVQLRIAAMIVALEALALLAATGVLVVKTATQSTGSIASALLLAALAVLGALVLGFGARGLLALRQGARTPIVVIQVLALPVAYSLGFQAGRMEYGGPILVAALATLYLLFTPPARAVLDHRRD
ncbi:MAG TPA: hypothetical protein VGL26_04970 [Jatrophihabitans sp.]